MEIIRIQDRKSPFFPAFAALYAHSFPIFEQRTDAQQDRALASARYHLDIYHEGGTLIGFLSYWNFDDYLYIEHFAVDGTLRGQGYGGKLLAELAARHCKAILLEIDPVVDDIAAARLRFYLKCGFCTNPYPHTHPPYRHGFEAHRLVVLSSGRPLTEEEYRRFCDDLRTTVMT